MAKSKGLGKGLGKPAPVKDMALGKAKAAHPGISGGSIGNEKSTHHGQVMAHAGSHNARKWGHDC